MMPLNNSIPTTHSLAVLDDSGQDANNVQPGSPWLDFAIFVVPALKFLQFNLIGSLYASDLLLVGLFCGLLCRRHALRPLRAPLPKVFLAFAVLWFVSQAVTDIVRQTPAHDYARGWAKIVLTPMHFSVLYLLLHDRPRQIVIYGWGLVLGSILTFFFNPFVYAADYPWEFGWGFPVTLAAFLLVSGRNYRSLTLPILLALTNLLMGFRSMGAVCFLASIYLLLRVAWLKQQPRRLTRVKLRYAVAIAMILVLGGWGMMSVYKMAAISGVMGEPAQRKYEFESSGDYGVLLGGRSSILIALLAIYDSPLLGHGSWASDPDYVETYQEMMLLLGYDAAAFQRGQGRGIDSSGDDDYLIGGHSAVLSAWVESGILGALVWLWVLIIAFRSLSRLYRLRSGLAPVATFCALWLIWYVCFEPYGGALRFNSLYYLVVAMSTITLASERTQQVEPEIRVAG